MVRVAVKPDGNYVDSDGDLVWVVDGGHHRSDGPAIEWHDGDVSWCWYGQYYMFNEWLEMNTEISGEQAVMLKLQYG